MEIKAGKREVTSNGYFFTQGKMQVLLWHKWILLGKQKIEISKWKSRSEKISFACYAVPSLAWECGRCLCSSVFESGIMFTRFLGPRVDVNFGTLKL